MTSRRHFGDPGWNFIEALAQYLRTGNKAEAVRYLSDTYPYLERKRLAELVGVEQGNVSRALAHDWL